MDKDRRGSTRIDEARIVPIFGGAGGDERRGSGYVFSLSETGLGFESDNLLREGEEVVLDVQIPIRVTGRITRVETRGSRFAYGIAFGKLKLIDRFFLKRHLKSKQRKRK